MAEAWVLDLMGFACRGCCESWVCGVCLPLYPLPPFLPPTVRLLSLKFSLVFVVVVVVVWLFIIFFFSYGIDFWMDADCGGSRLAVGLGLLLNVDGLWWWWLTVAIH